MLQIGFKRWRHICLIKHPHAAINKPSQRDTLLPPRLLEWRKPDSGSLIFPFIHLRQKRNISLTRRLITFHCQLSPRVCSQHLWGWDVRRQRIKTIRSQHFVPRYRFYYLFKKTRNWTSCNSFALEDITEIPSSCGNFCYIRFQAVFVPYKELTTPLGKSLKSDWFQP